LEVTVKGVPPTTVTLASPDEVCVVGDVDLTIDPIPAFGIDYQWQKDDGFGFVDIVGATDPAYTEVGLTVTTSYQVQAYCDGALAGTSSPVTVTVNNPQLLSTMGATRCGDGTVDLEATADPGITINWYDVPTGGTPIATGNVFTTPVISTTTDFYVSASTGGSGSIYVGPVDPASVGTSSGTTAAITTYHMAFDVLVPTTIVSVDIYPTAAVGSSEGIEIRDNADNIIANIPFVTTVTGGSTPQTITLNVSLPPGTGYKMGQNPAIALIRNSAGASYPYSTPTINILGKNS